MLNDYAKKLRSYRANGVKVLFRPRYDKELDPGSPSNCTMNGVKVLHADSKIRQFNHIDAVAAMLGDHRDVIAYIQAGYLGRWGEWNTAEYQSANAPLLYNYPIAATSSCGALHLRCEDVLHNVELRRPVFAKKWSIGTPARTSASTTTAS